jgi:hypothetical protein
MIYSINNNNNNNNNNKEKNNFQNNDLQIKNPTITACFRLTVDLHENSKAFASAYGCSWTRLINLALMDFMVANRDKTKRPINLTVNQITELPKEEKVNCQIGQCKSEAVSSGVYQNKEYLLCSSHSKSFAGSKGWKIL